VLGSRLAPYALLTFAGSLLWCFGFAAAGWALGSRWEGFHHGFRFADYAAVAGLVVAGGAVALWRWRQTTSPGRSR
jgi:membrane protein DedA with SNARE-associated domain